MSSQDRYAIQTITEYLPGLDFPHLEIIDEWMSGKGRPIGQVNDEEPQFRHGHALNSNEGADCVLFTFSNFPLI